MKYPIAWLLLAVSISSVASRVFLRKKFASSEGGGKAVFDALLFVDGGEVFLDRVRREAEDEADLGTRFSHDEAIKDADFAPNERQAEAAGASMTLVCLVVLLT